MKHTPGPWIVGNNKVDIHDTTVEFGPIATCMSSRNARLIASAPEMLEALERIEVMLRGRDKIPTGETEFLLSLIEPSIKKARGE